jgi:hypothetical protein
MTKTEKATLKQHLMVLEAAQMFFDRMEKKYQIERDAGNVSDTLLCAIEESGFILEELESE